MVEMMPMAVATGWGISCVHQVGCARRPVASLCGLLFERITTQWYRTLWEFARECAGRASRAVASFRPGHPRAKMTPRPSAEDTRSPSRRASQRWQQAAERRRSSWRHPTGRAARRRALQASGLPDPLDEQRDRFVDRAIAEDVSGRAGNPKRQMPERQAHNVWWSLRSVGGRGPRGTIWSR